MSAVLSMNTIKTVPGVWISMYVLTEHDHALYITKGAGSVLNRSPYWLVFVIALRNAVWGIFYCTLAPLYLTRIPGRTKVMKNRSNTAIVTQIAMVILILFLFFSRVSLPLS